MATIFISLPAPAANGSGAATDASAFGATKTFIISGTWSQEPLITIEFNNSASSSDGSWQAIRTVQGAAEFTIDVACKWLRATVASFRGGATPVVNVGGTDDGTTMVNVVAPAGDGNGAGVDVSALGLFKTVQVAGTFKGSTLIESSNDNGVTWVTQSSFQSPGALSGIYAIDLVRVSRSGVPQVGGGLPIVNIGIADSGGGGGGDGVDLEINGDAVAGGPFATLNLFGARAVSSGGGTAIVPVGINVLDFGAVGDGTTDDTLAIMAAIDEAVDPASPLWGMPVLFPPTAGGGRYLIVSTDQPSRVPAIQLDASYSNLKLIGSGGAGLVVDSVCIDGVSGSPGIELMEGFHDLDVDGLNFYGPANDDKDLNFFGAYQMAYGSTDIRIRNCTFDHITPVNASTAPQGDDEIVSSRLSMDTCHMKNCPNGVHPPSDTKIVNCFFECTTISATRAQAIYKFGAFQNIQIIGCTFYRITKQAVQIRGVEAQWNQMCNFRIEGCSFQECDQYAIFCGSDSLPNVTQAAIIGNTFLNCNGPIQCQGIGSAVISGNVIHYTWEWPFGPVAFSTAIFASTGVGLPGHYNARSTVVITGNKISHVQPYVGRVQFNSNPADGNTITVGGITYTFRNSPSTDWDIQRDVTTRGTVEYFVRALQGYGDEIPVPNNVLRQTVDTFNNFYGSNPTLAIISSFFTIALSHTGAFATITASSDYRTSCVAGITCQFLTGGVIANNKMDDFVYGVVVQNCLLTDVHNNQNSNQTGQATAIIAQYNARNSYRENRCVSPDALNQGRPWYSQYFDGFSVIDDDATLIQEGCYGPLMGRSGTTPIGDGRAHCWLWYGRGIPDSDPPDPSTNMFRWQDGDQVNLYDGADHIFTYKFVTPGAGEFNSPDSLLALLGAVAGFDATYQPYTNRTSIPDPEVMIRVNATATGTAGNNARLYAYRPRYPGQAMSTAENTQQPLVNALILRDSNQSEAFSRFGGGAATLVATFVFTPIANPERGVQVWGLDAASHALDPRVYTADIIPGVGFKITHSAGAGTESFGYRVNSQ